MGLSIELWPMDDCLVDLFSKKEILQTVASYEGDQKIPTDVIFTAVAVLIQFMKVFVL